MSKNFWINFHRIMVFIRFDIYSAYNYEVINIIIDSIKNRSSNDEMCTNVIRIVPMWKNQLLLKGRGEDCEIQEDKEIVKFVVCALENIKDYLINDNYDISYDLLDILQALPDMECYFQKTYLKKYWKIYIKPFEKKWKRSIFEDVEYIFKGRIP